MGTEPDVSPLALQGPKSIELLSDLYGRELVQSLKYFDFARGEVTALPSLYPNRPPIPTLLARSGWSPEQGYEIYLEDGSRGGELWDMCWKAGQKYSIKPGAPNQQRRIEGGMISFGGDTLKDTNPLEFGLPKRFVDPFGDHEFIGKEALQKISRDGVRRKFVGLDFMDDAFRANDCWAGRHLPIYTMHENGVEALSNYVMNENGDVVQTPQAGVLTTCAPSPLFGKKLGLGYVQTDLAVPGTLVGVQMASGRMVAALVSKLPFKQSDALGGRARSP